MKMAVFWDVASHLKFGPEVNAGDDACSGRLWTVTRIEVIWNRSIRVSGITEESLVLKFHPK
jgi:hypothetical protein